LNEGTQAQDIYQLTTINDIPSIFYSYMKLKSQRLTHKIHIYAISI
jgi:hypothetical protein